MSVLLRDLRYAIRMLLKAPGFAVAAVVTLALAIGVNTAMFSLVNTAVLAPLPFEDADRLVRVFRQTLDGEETDLFSYLDYCEYRDRSDVFEDLVAFSYLPTSIDTGDGSESRFGQIVTGNYFVALGVEAQLGRVLTSKDSQTPGANPVVVLSHRYWQRAFGGKPEVIGQTITLGAHPFTIVGVAPKGFAGAIPITAPDLWIPISMIDQIRPEQRGQLEVRESSFLWVSGKLMPGMTIDQAQARLDVTASQLEEVDPERYADEHALLVPADGVIPMTPAMRSTAVAISTLIMAMVGLVLVVGCANIANLLLARATARRKEIGIRLALGAPRSRIVRQLLTESMLLALIGGAAGLLLAVWTMDALVASLPRLPFDLTIELDFGIDRRVFLFTAVVAILSGTLFGLLPALGATKVNVVTSLKDDHGFGSPGVKRSRLQNALVVGQVSASLVLLVVAGLFVRSLTRAHAIDPGFDHEKVFAATLDIGAHDYDRARSADFCEQLLTRTRALPGVESASLETCPPLTMTMSSREFWIEGRPYADAEDETTSVAYSEISDSNFRTLGIPLLLGRDFATQDSRDALRAAIVNKAFVDRFWPKDDPIGKRISTAGPEGPFLEVVGVVATIKYWLVGEEPRPYVYLAASQRPPTSFVALLVRTTGDPSSLAAPIRTIVREIDPDMALTDASSLTEKISFILLPARFAAAGFGLFGLLALVLASVGLYGVMSYAVSQRTREIGIRATLGAQRGDILRLMMGQGITLTAIGLAIGLAICLAGTHLLSALLYEIGATDPLTFVSVALLLITVTLLACYLPARRAAKVDPMVALRCE